MKRWLALMLLLLLFLPGCRRGPDLSGLPPLELLQEEDGTEYILLDGVRYDRVPFEVVGSGHSGRWNLCAQPGRRVAVLGPDTIFTIQGDEEERFLYNVAESFRFGGMYHYLFLREGDTLTLPDSPAAFDRGTIRTYASGGLFGKKAQVTCEFTDEEILAALFGLWNGTVEPSPAPEELDTDRRESRCLELWNKEYPWLNFRISGSWYGGGDASFLSREEKSVFIPREVADRLTWEEPGLWQRLW